MHEPPYRTKNMMPGMIMLWYGSIETIPSGWHLCNGTMGTPNLEYKFVRGAGATAHPGDTGGTEATKSDFTGDGHSHTIPAGTGLMAGEDYALETEVDQAVGTTEFAENRPPFRNLCYIMKL